MDFLGELSWRGVLDNATPGAEDHLRQPRTGYVGFDPTAESLTIGNLCGILTLKRFQLAGHRPVALVGGGTGLIGDPSGKDAERTLASREEIAHRVEKIGSILSKYLDFSGPAGAMLVDNHEWLGPEPLLAFLRDTGKHFTVNYMLAKESVKRRIETGISITEFSYMLLQARDFQELKNRYNCTLQFGGSDQWGNITAGIELGRRTGAGQLHGATWPLVLRADGRKFGKSEEGALWVTPQHTSPYALYQYFINVPDPDVERFLKTFTLLSQQEIEGVITQHEAAPHKRDGQRRLAAEVTRFLHGEEALAGAEAASRILFGGEVRGVAAAVLQEVFSEVPAQSVSRDALGGEGLTLVDALVLSSAVKSKGEARRLLKGGGIYVNQQKAAPDTVLGLDDLLDGGFVVLRKGRRNYYLLKAE